MYGLDAEGNVTDVDVEYPKAEATRRKRQGKEADRKVAAALRRGHPNILPLAYTSSGETEKHQGLTLKVV